MAESKNKIMIIGFDGVDPDLLDKLVSEGILPNFKRLIENGAYSRIKSSIPIITTVTWTSFITGKNPGKHGIFGFVNFKDDSFRLNILNSSDRKTEGIWKILNRYGVSVGIFNLPSLYPPEEINKFMVCGMLTPNKNCRFTYPKELQDQLLKKIPDYEIDVGVIKAAYNSRGTLLKNMYFLTDKRYEATKFLLKEYPCDCFISIITETDRMQHYFLNDFEALRKYFIYLDTKLGELLADIDSNTTIFILSDHGMGPFKKYIYVNKWLLDNGYLTINKQSTSFVKHSFSRKAIQSIITLLSKTKFDVEKIKKWLPAKLVNKITYLYCYYGGVDWQKTQAYFCSGAGEGIIINSKKRFAGGVVDDQEYEIIRDRIIQDLLELRDSETGLKVIENAYKREEIFSGEYVSAAPDIVLKLHHGYATNESVEVDKFLEASPPDEMLVAEHRLEGIFIASGPLVKSGFKGESASILDIAPTLFAVLGIPIPSSFDGKVLQDIFKNDTIEELKPAYSGGNKQLLRDRIRELKKKGKI